MLMCQLDSGHKVLSDESPAKKVVVGERECWYVFMFMHTSTCDAATAITTVSCWWLLPPFFILGAWTWRYEFRNSPRSEARSQFKLIYAFIYCVAMHFWRAYLARYKQGKLRIVEIFAKSLDSFGTPKTRDSPNTPKSEYIKCTDQIVGPYIPSYLEEGCR